MALALRLFGIFDYGEVVLSAKIVRHGAELAPCSVGYFSLIMFCLKSLARVEIYIVDYYVRVNMGMVGMNGKYILVLVIEKCLA